MPAVSRDALAKRLRQNWLAKNPQDTCSNGGVNLDDSLTSLSWLQNLNIMKIGTGAPTPPPSPIPQETVVVKNMFPQLTTIQPPKLDSRLNYSEVTSFNNGYAQDNIDYKNNPYVKPPYSYATLICMAMKETKKNKITLSAIYNWITDNFMYYRMADPSWQNSIRHNLSLNKCFEKVPRRKDEPGKGGFWRINPEFSDMIENGIFKKRRGSRDCCPVPPPKRIKREEETFAALNGNLDDENQVLVNGSVLYFGVQEDDQEQSDIKTDFNWTSILQQDIEVGGVRIKTEQLLDEDDAASPILAMSPPSSESNSDDLGLDDLLAQADLTNGVSNSEQFSDNPLDLTVTGHNIRAPDWWEEALNVGVDSGKLVDITHHQNHGLNTPVYSSSPVYESEQIWLPAMDDVGSAFDMDNLFDIDNIPSPYNM
ncbi:hypothetical protein SNE40_005671 [Patella caerulea]|uniref:Fork-head domain-containing protein n=1 Tax=Patella caerulea TaxID=87958 RepID=A0AAN8PWS7_PATCE